MKYCYLNYFKTCDNHLKGYLVITDTANHVKTIHDKIYNQVEPDVRTHELSFNNTQITKQTLSTDYPFINHVNLIDNLNDYIQELNNKYSNLPNLQRKLEY